LASTAASEGDAAARLQHELDSREEAEQQRMLSRQREEAARLTAEVERQTEALRKANAQALASSEAKSKFLSSASHELRAPLHDLLGYAQLLAREIPPEAQSHLSVIQKSGQAAAAPDRRHPRVQPRRRQADGAR
jgi:signal transduction histidine kinase